MFEKLFNEMMLFRVSPDSNDYNPISDLPGFVTLILKNLVRSLLNLLFRCMNCQDEILN